MIKYKLVCERCNLLFDSWFASSKEFENLKKKKLLSCHVCNSKKIKKTLMAPKLLKKLKNKNSEINALKFKEINKKIKEYQKFIKNNFKYVGDNFAYEARSIHYKTKKKSEKGIYGNATLQDLKELKEEGIETETITWINEKDN